MSIIIRIGGDITRIPAILEEYEAEFDEAIPRLQIKGKTLSAALTEQSSWMVYYDQRRIELRALNKWVEREIDRVRGKLWKQYTENVSISLNTKDKEQYINNESAYLNLHSIYLEVNELFEKYEVLIDGFKNRGFALNNLVKVKTCPTYDDIEI